LSEQFAQSRRISIADWTDEQIYGEIMYQMNSADCQTVERMKVERMKPDENLEFGSDEPESDRQMRVSMAVASS
jgi:hypothetical protein